MARSPTSTLLERLSDSEWLCGGASPRPAASPSRWPGASLLHRPGLLADSDRPRLAALSAAAGECHSSPPTFVTRNP